MKQLIVNADDFGLHKNVNNAVIAGHITGCITSTSLMAGAQAFEHAVALAAANPQLGIGVHLTLVGGRPVTAAERVSSLIDEDGMFCTGYSELLRKYCSGRVRLEHVRQELAAQVSKVLATGVAVTHLDSHQHMHIVPGIIDVVIDIAKQFAIPAMRIPAEPMLFFGGFKPAVGRLVGRCGLSVLAGLARVKARRAGLVVPDNFYGMLAGGSLEEKLLLRIIAGLPDGVSEIMVHPGLDDSELNTAFAWNYHWQQELAAVTSRKVSDYLQQSGIALMSYAEVSELH